MSMNLHSRIKYKWNGAQKDLYIHNLNANFSQIKFGYVSELLQYDNINQAVQLFSEVIQNAAECMKKSSSHFSRVKYNQPKDVTPSWCDELGSIKSQKKCLLNSFRQTKDHNILHSYRNIYPGIIIG